MNKNERNVESTTSVESNEMGTWQVAMADAPDFNANKSSRRERAVATPLSSFSPEERRAKLRIIHSEGGKIVAVPAEEVMAARAGAINASELDTDVSDIDTSVTEAQTEAKREPEAEAKAEKPASSKEMNATEKELMQARLDAMYKEMSAIERALGDEGKTPERIREQKMQKVGRGLLKFSLKTVEILGGAAAGAAFPILFTLLSNMA
ncbi:MAG: hypothetical protein MJ155_01025 [Candidatus Saccharibacteria bacterium]|nr:hypothetical protein [Candidatus Saccharibacteria bacterium]